MNGILKLALTLSLVLVALSAATAQDLNALSAAVDKLDAGVKAMLNPAKETPRPDRPQPNSDTATLAQLTVELAGVKGRGGKAGNGRESTVADPG